LLLQFFFLLYLSLFSRFPRNLFLRSYLLMLGALVIFIILDIISLAIISFTLIVRFNRLICLKLPVL